MEYNKAIADMMIGDQVEGFYLLKEAAQKTTNAGKPFLTGVIADRTGAMELKVWDYNGPISAADMGKAVKVRATITEFKNAPQLIAGKIRLATEADGYDTSALIPTAPIQADKAMEYVRNLVESIEDPDYKAVAQTLLDRNAETFQTIPAAKSVHHGFRNGLLMHTANMLNLADFLADQYQEVIDRSLLLAGTLLHDMMKCEEFDFSPLGLVTDYSVKGELLGHLVMGARAVDAVARELEIPEEKSVLLQHLILSHHGEPEFGAAVRPMCAEAELLAYIDKLDSRMEIYEEALKNVPEGAFSQRIFALEKRIYHHP